MANKGLFSKIDNWTLVPKCFRSSLKLATWTGKLRFLCGRSQQHNALDVRILGTILKFNGQTSNIGDLAATGPFQTAFTPTN